MPLTDISVRQAKPRTRPYKVSDGGGLMLLIQPNGAKWWRMRYRFEGREKMLSLGLYPEVSLSLARERHGEARRQLVEGLDPSLVRRREKAGDDARFDAVAREWLEKQKVGMSRATYRKARWIIEDLVLPKIGARPIAKLTAREVLDVLEPIDAGGHHETAKRMRQRVSQIFRYAIATSRADRDVAASLRGALRPGKVQHRAALVHPERVRELLRAIWGYAGQPSTAAALKLAPLVFVRPGELRDSLDRLHSLPIVTPRGQLLVLSDVASIRIDDGPPMLRSENARLAGFVYVDLRDRDLGTAVREMQQSVVERVALPPGYSVSWSGQFEFLERAKARLQLVVPFTLLIIFVLLFMTFKQVGEALLLMATLPFALIGGVWLLFALGHHLSVAGVVGFVALAGVAAEFGVIMLLYLKQAWTARLAQNQPSEAQLLDAIREGAVLRVRPKAMTVAVILGGLFPIMWGSGAGSDIMQRIAAPMVGGMITAPLLSMFVIPAAFYLMHRPRRSP